MKNSTFFSIIIPVYNTPADALKLMFESIQKQNYQNFEIIVIDDGSKEECALLLDTLSEKNDEMKIYHKENGGVSSARNFGIKVAKGNYIVFVDADDLISENFLEEADTYLQKTMADVIFGVMEYIPPQKDNQQKKDVYLFQGEELQKVYNTLLKINHNRFEYDILGTPCARVYSSSLVKQTLFQEGIPLCEDQIFNRMILKKAAKVLVVPNTWYYYIQNQFSATHTVFYKNYFKMAAPYWDVLFDLNLDESIDVRKALNIQALGLLYTAMDLDCIKPPLSLKERIKRIEERVNHKLIKEAIKNTGVFSKDLRFTQKIGLILLKVKNPYLLYIAEKIKLMFR